MLFRSVAFLCMVVCGCVHLVRAYVAFLCVVVCSCVHLVREGTGIEAPMRHELLSKCVWLLLFWCFLCVVVYTWCVRAPKR